MTTVNLIQQAGSEEIVFSLFSNPKLFVVFEQVKNIVHEVIFMWVLFIMQGVLEGLLEYRYNIDSVCCRHKLQGALYFLNELVSACSCLFVHVDFVCDYDAGYVRTLVAHFLVPVPKILISHLPIHVKHQDASMRSKVIGWVQLIE